MGVLWATPALFLRLLRRCSLGYLWAAPALLLGALQLYQQESAVGANQCQRCSLRALDQRLHQRCDLGVLAAQEWLCLGSMLGAKELQLWLC